MVDREEAKAPLIVPISVVAKDLDRDGKLDLAVANAGSDDVSVLIGNGKGKFSAPTNFPAGDDPFSVVAKDLNRDGKPDLAVANFGSDDVSVLINKSSK